MIRNPAQRALVEVLEPRQLLSASPHIRAHPSPIPNLLGTYVGHSTPAAGAAVLLSLNVSSQKGAAVAGSSVQGDGSIGHFNGSINRKNVLQITLRSGSSKTGVKWVGTLAGDTLAGTFLNAAKGHHDTGTFSTTKLATSDAVLSGPTLDPATGHFYYLLASTDWATAQATAVSLGGNLVTINDVAENTWVYNNFAIDGGVGRSLWTGFDDPANDTLTGPAHAANFVWVDGETSAYTNWNAGEPNNFNHSQFYAYIMAPHWGKNGAWDDAPGSSTVDNFGAGFYGVAEIAP